MSGTHPYKSAPRISFWSRAVSRDWNPMEVVHAEEFLIRRGDNVVSAGSCFASNIIPYLEKAGLTYLRTEERHPLFRDLEPEALGYDNFSAAYGNIYTARQLLQLLKRCLGKFSPVEDRWTVGDDIIDSLRPGLRYRARSHLEFDLLTAQHLRRTREAFESADVFIFTLGLTEGWTSRRDGTVFPACPGTVAGTFDSERHEFKNFTVAEIVSDLNEFINLLGEVNPSVRIIITVSPVPLVATASGSHVLSATVYSKSVLRVAAGMITACHRNTVYFPAYEIITGPQAPAEFFEKDRRTVSQTGIETVMNAMLAHCESDHAINQFDCKENINEVNTVGISRLIAEMECEEVMTDPSLLSRDRTEQVQPGIGQSEPGDETAIWRFGPRELRQEREREWGDRDSWRHTQQALAHAEPQSSSRSDVMPAELVDTSLGIKARLDRLEVLAVEQTALLDKLIERDSEEIENLQQRLASVYDSTSWRLTAPFRAAVDFVRRQGKSPGMSRRVLRH